ncbi:MAG TPA: hypothetical protein VLA93_03505 [Pyrinomonadaceae bacterium]|nr:hypothetical protein [Pyrinomonadaceae bacterium]
MKLVTGFFALVLFIVSSSSVYAQASPSDAKQFNKDGVMFNYLPNWTLVDDSNGDAQQVTLSRTDTEVQIRVFIHRGRITPEKLPQARKAFIDSYINSTAKQFIAMGAKPEQSPDSTDIGTTKAEGVNIKASLGGETGAAKIYWALINERVVVLTYFGPDKELKKHEPLWDLVRSSLQIEAKKPAVKPSPSPKQ